MTTLTRSLNRQETLFYFWIAALVWLGLALVAVIVWAVASASTTRLIRLGTLADFPPRAKPYYVPIERDGQPSAAVYIVHMDAQIIALNAENKSKNSLFVPSEWFGFQRTSALKARAPVTNLLWMGNGFHLSPTRSVAWKAFRWKYEMAKCGLI